MRIRLEIVRRPLEWIAVSAQDKSKVVAIEPTYRRLDEELNRQQRDEGVLVFPPERAAA